MMLLSLLISCGGDKIADSAESGEPEPFWAEPADCADIVHPSDSDEALIRWPYVQWVTTDAATVAWGVSTDAKGATLELGRDDGYGISADATHQDIPYVDDGTLMRLFSARIEGLEPGTEYCYRVTVDGVVQAAGLRFTTAPASPNAPIKFLVIGDFGTGSHEQQTLAEVIARHADGAHLWITTGDNAYGEGTYQQLHDYVFTIYQELMTSIPVFATPGNHDYKTDKAQPYLDNFFLPENAWKEKDRERYYSIDFGPMHFQGLDSEDSLVIKGSDEQSQPIWAEADLQAADRPWNVSAFHKPVYSGHPERGPDPLVYLHLMPLFDEYGLDLGLTGHNHFYERFALLREGELDEDGATWIVTGGGGQSLYEVETEEYQEVMAEEFHFMVFEMDPCTITGRAISIDDQIIDEFTISQCD